MEANLINLKASLINFVAITKEIIEHIKNDEYEKLDSLLRKRQDIIDLINKNGCDQEQFRKISFELMLQETEASLNELMNKKHDFLIKELKKIASSRKVNSSYNPKGYVDSLYFNKKL